MCTGCGQMQRNDQSRIQVTRQARQSAPVTAPTPVDQHNAVVKIRHNRDKAIQDQKRQAFHQNKLGGG